MTIVDPMHNLFLGTSKHFMSVLLDNKKLSKEHLTSIQEIVSSVNVPDGVGRISWKIQSGFSSLTAEQWRNWTVIYSIVALKNILSIDIIECWRHFVLACPYLMQHELTQVDIQIAYAMSMRFCSKFEALFGTNHVPPNMHLHGHINDRLWSPSEFLAICI